METNAELRYAGFWIRTLALIIDSLIYTLIFFIIESFLGHNTLASKALGAALIILFYVGFLISPWQATPGKYILKIYIKPTGQGSMHFMRACLRSFAISLPFLPMLIFSFAPEVNQLTLKFQELSQNGLTHNEFLSFAVLVEERGFIVDLYAYSITFFTLASPIWYISAAFSKEKAAIHDRISQTRVVYGRAQKNKGL